MASSAPKVGYLLRAWHEVPEVIGSAFMALVGVGFGVAGLCLYNERRVDQRKYKFFYTVYRPDDPKVANIKKHCGLDNL